MTRNLFFVFVILCFSAVSNAQDKTTDSVSTIDAQKNYIEGEKYFYGRGVNKDYSEALKWYRKAAEMGHASGQNTLGYMYKNGLGVAKDYAEAFKWYKMSAEQGYDAGQNNLGYMY